ncbi:hypothetical protein EOV40_011560 [Acetobacter oryzoeni]|uniref:Uncharacterized protein n=2 Tax=Acetobacter oryzoeni TaxID=2500548 RepID=A0A5B9GL56_9PROT|nr:hypothetical protein [Acetobacter oryzoeni]QEE86279.1 hypothetical protein EOV40_011560 [Acetobacter oryzoeni]
MTLGNIHESGRLSGFSSSRTTVQDTHHEKCGRAQFSTKINTLDIVLENLPNIYMFEYMKSHYFYDSDLVHEYIPFVVMINSAYNYAIASFALGFWVITKKLKEKCLSLVMGLYSLIIISCVIVFSFFNYGLFGSIIATGTILVALTYFAFIVSTSIKQKSIFWVVPAIFMIALIVIPFTQANTYIVGSSLANTHIGNFDASICQISTKLNEQKECKTYHIEMKINNYIYAKETEKGKINQFPTAGFYINYDTPKHK